VSDIFHNRARVGALSRSRDEDDPELLAARRDLKAARLTDYVQRTLASAPPLTPEQRAKLAELLKPVRREAGAS
jgi:Spy/CpxP family protein refolding chaperone